MNECLYTCARVFTFTHVHTHMWRQLIDRRLRVCTAVSCYDCIRRTRIRACIVASAHIHNTRTLS